MWDRAPRPRLTLSLAVAALMGLLVLLATLQYRWLGQVGEAERARLQAGARGRAEQLAQDFDREITRAFAALGVDGDMLEGDDGAARFGDRYDRWTQTAHAPLVSAVFVAREEGGRLRLRRFEPGARRFVDAPWPAAIDALRVRLEDFARGPRLDRPDHSDRADHSDRPDHADRPGRPERGDRMERAGRRGPFGFLAAEAPALVVPIPAPDDAPREGARGFAGPRFAGTTIILLDRDYIRGDLLPALATRYFASGGEFDYCVVVTSRRDPQEVIYRSDPGDAAHPVPDATASLLEVRFEDIESGLLPADAGRTSFVARRSPPRDGRRPGFVARPPNGFGLWEVGVTHRAGSLETLVARTRRRNLAISFGILLLLGASSAMIVVSSQRARRLAAQQVEFVAGVSHELRTPVAVVCAAAENLADGLVREPEDVRVYGATIRDEGRRLADMIEQVLDFAGIAARPRPRPTETVDVASLVADALKACAPALREQAFDTEVEIAPGLPRVRGDAAALRRAVQNLVQNAIKYGRDGRWVGVRAEVARAGRREVVRLTVRDRGMGVTAGEERRIFEPFYRGKEAQAAGIAGSGLGLSLVERIARAHGGEVEVESMAGAGTAFTLVLPAALPAPVAAVDVEGTGAEADPAR